jgi:hypothetical protein
MSSSLYQYAYFVLDILQMGAVSRQIMEDHIDAGYNCASTSAMEKIWMIAYSE